MNPLTRWKFERTMDRWVRGYQFAWCQMPWEVRLASAAFRAAMWVGSKCTDWMDVAAERNGIRRVRRR